MGQVRKERKEETKKSTSAPELLCGFPQEKIFALDSQPKPIKKSAF
jgi:hypothetical protein